MGFVMRCITDVIVVVAGFGFIGAILYASVHTLRKEEKEKFPCSDTEL